MGGYCLNWTPWRVWAHPCKACKAITDAGMTEMNLDNKLKEALEFADRQRTECQRLTVDMAEMSRRLLQVESELASTRAELSKARAILDEQESVDIKLAEFNRMLSKVEDMKRSYEKRISTLEARLRDARARLAKEDNYDLFESIDMKKGLNAVNPEERHGASVTRKAKEKAILLENSNRDAGSPRKEAQPEKRAPGLPEEFPKPATPDDWLLTLPDSL